MTRCICQLCNEMKEIEAWTPEDSKTTLRLIGIEGSRLPICYDCILQKTRDPQYFIATLEELLRSAKKYGYKVQGKYDVL